MRRIGVLTLLLPLLQVAAWGQAAAGPAGAAAASAAPARLPQVAMPLTLTPDAAAAMAVARSTEIAIARQAIASAEGSLQQAEAIRRVKVQANVAHVRQGPIPTFELSGQKVNLSASAANSQSVTVTKPLYLGRRDRYAYEAAQAGVEAARGAVTGNEVDVALAARQRVYGTLRLEQLALVAQQQVTAVAEHLRVTQAMLDAGTTPRFEVVQAETNLAQYRGDVIRALTAVALSKAQLATTLNLPQGGDLKVEEGTPLALPEGTLQELIGQALAGRPEVQAQQAAIRAQEANLRLARANNKSQLALQGTVANQNDDPTDPAVNWTITLAWSKPLVDGGETRGKVQTAQAAVETARLQLERLQQQIALQVSQAHLAVADAREVLTVAEQGEVNARERARIAEVRFQSGVGLGVEVLDAQTALAHARTQVVNARYELQAAVASLRAALGLTDLTKEPAR